MWKRTGLRKGPERNNIDHFQLLSRLGLTKPADVAAERAYKNREARIHQQDLESAPHGSPWSTSFHASSFPGGDKPCGRKLLYGLMNIPSAAPVTPALRAIMDAGKALEIEYVSRYEEDGVLLSRPPTDPYQTGFSDNEHWLTGNLDAVIRPEGWNRGHLVEIKGKDHDVIDAMRYGRRSYDEKHLYQLQTYLGFLQTASFELYQDYATRKKLDIANLGLDDIVGSGSILYVSRQRPRHTCEFYFEFNADGYDTGLELLRDYRNNFIEGVLPNRDKTWKWLDEPCKYCDFKRLCKADDKQGVVGLRDSNAIAVAQSLRPDYQYVLQRENVLKRWGVDDESED